MRPVDTRDLGGGQLREPSWAEQLHGLYLDSPAMRRQRRQRQFRRRRVGAVLILATVVAGGVYLVEGVTSSSRPTASTPGKASNQSAGTHRPVVPTSVAPPALNEPGGGRTLFPNRRIVAFYGAAGIPRLGILGSQKPEQLWPQLAAQAAPYDQPATPVLPAYELIAFVTNAAPGSDHSDASRISDDTIEAYLSTVRAHHGLLILDIQPGRGDFLADVQSLARWLAEPDVGLALDPEWKLDANQLPSKQIGHTTAAAVNAVSTWLAQLVASKNLPQKLLLIHQFTDDMVTDKASVQAFPGLAMVFNMDGFGAQEVKAVRYQALAADNRFSLGFKVFYKQDKNPYSPGDLLALTPAPSVVEYQ
ncbi:MAG: hypothetical protein QOF81_1412 [Acidimicrobiaceae bacterium]|nr:hypothetical protein [Acidimicrobiaceae bacterium]